MSLDCGKERDKLMVEIEVLSRIDAAEEFRRKVCQTLGQEKS